MTLSIRIWKWLAMTAGLVIAMIAVLGLMAYAQNVPQGYQSDQGLQKGMVVRLKPNDGSKIQAVTQQDDGEMFGVIVSSSDAAVSLSNTPAGQELFVANAGQYEVLISDQNGPIKTGDYIAISSLGGIGMKANSKQEFALGKALGDFDGKSRAESTTTLKTSGGEKSIHIGRVAVEVLVAHNPNYKKDNEQPGVPDVLASLVQVVTDKPLSPLRIYASLAVILLCIVIAGSILFAGVRTGMVAVGRNPLAKKSIFRNLLQVTIMALIVFVIGVIAVYLLLRV